MWMFTMFIQIKLKLNSSSTDFYVLKGQLIQEFCEEGEIDETV